MWECFIDEGCSGWNPDAFVKPVFPEPIGVVMFADSSAAWALAPDLIAVVDDTLGLLGIEGHHLGIDEPVENALIIRLYTDYFVPCGPLLDAAGCAATNVGDRHWPGADVGVSIIGDSATYLRHELIHALTYAEHNLREGSAWHESAYADYFSPLDLAVLEVWRRWPHVRPPDG